MKVVFFCGYQECLSNDFILDGRSGVAMDLSFATARLRPIRRTGRPDDSGEWARAEPVGITEGSGSVRHGNRMYGRKSD